MNFRQMLRLVVLACVAAVLLAALPQVAVCLALTLLVPVRFFFATVISAPIAVFENTRDVRLFPDLPVLSPRPPPAI